MIMSDPNGGPFGPQVFRPQFVSPLYYHSDTDSEDVPHSMSPDNCHLPGIVHSQLHVKIAPGGQRRLSDGAGVSSDIFNLSLGSRKSLHSLSHGQNQQTVDIKINSSNPPRVPPRHKRKNMKVSSAVPSIEDDSDVIMKPGSITQNSIGTTTNDGSSTTLGRINGGSEATLALPDVDEMPNNDQRLSPWPWSLVVAKKMMRRASHPLEKNACLIHMDQSLPTPLQLPPNGVPPIATITTTSRSAGTSIVNRSIGIQATASRYRLRCMPEFKQKSSLALAGRWVLSQLGLAILLTLWAVAGSAVFHASEYPRESRQQKEVDQLQREISLELSQDLRLIEPREPNWLITIEKYLNSHEEKLLAFVAEGYAEGSSTGGRIWTFAGCFLFSISLLTTLGFGAPVPRTTPGRISAVIFAAVGIPLHLILVLNVGQLSASLLLSLAARGQRHGLRMPVALIQCCCSRYFTREISDLRPDTPDIKLVSSMPPRWLKLLPIYCILTYYFFGVLIFGVARSRPVTSCFLFPLDFTATGGVANTPSGHRVFYALYLEGAMILAASCASLIQQSTQQGVTDLCLRWGLLTKETA